jgi:hypothetical protein
VGCIILVPLEAGLYVLRRRQTNLMSKLRKPADPHAPPCHQAPLEITKKTDDLPSPESLEAQTCSWRLEFLLIAAAVVVGAIVGFSSLIAG